MKHQHRKIFAIFLSIAVSLIFVSQLLLRENERKRVQGLSACHNMPCNLTCTHIHTTFYFSSLCFKIVGCRFSLGFCVDSLHIYALTQILALCLFLFYPSFCVLQIPLQALRTFYTMCITLIIKFNELAALFSNIRSFTFRCDKLVVLFCYSL